MIYQIQNEYLKIEVNSLGAQLWSIQDNSGKEYLWQGDEKLWKSRATNLFPFCGRMTDGKYTYQGKQYEIMIHGFAKLSEFEVITQEPAKLVLAITETESTLAMFPFRFRFLVSFALEGNKIKQSYIVENKDDKTMYFAVGGHPGFQVPIEDGLQFEDYEIKFEKARIEQCLLSEDYFMSDESVPCPDIVNGTMALRHSLFDRDAIILKDAGKEITIQSDKAKTKIRVAFPDMAFLAIWHQPRSEAPFVCIEPWTSLPARQDIIENLEEKKDLVALPAGEIYENNWQIELLK